MISKKSIAGLAGIIVICSLVTMTAFISNKSQASFVTEDNEENDFTDGTVVVKVKETGDNGNEFRNPDRWYGDEVTKNVEIENKSNVPSIIRVEITPRWVEVDKDGNEKPWIGDTSCVQINFDNVTNDITKTGTNEWIKENTSEDLGCGGYYYYNTILSQGEFTKNLINKVSANVPASLRERYNGKKLKIDVKAEVVIATKEAYKKTWNNINDGNIDSLLQRLCENTQI